MNTASAGGARRPRSLTLTLVQAINEQIQEGRLQPGHKLPTEALVMAEFGVSRTVVREAISKLQAAGLVATRHGVGTFVVGPGDTPAFRITAEQLETAREVIAVLELRIGVETEAAALAAQRRTEHNLLEMRGALQEFRNAVEEGRDAVAPDYQFHLEIARATQNEHFVELLGSMSARIIPRARLGPDARAQRQAYLMLANAEHEAILEAIARQDPESARAAMRTHLASSRARWSRAAAQAD